MAYIPTQSYEPGFPLEWEGLDYESANEATPRLYAVSYGNGNDGVSHMWPDFYCRTDDPYALARLAIITNLGESYQDWASEVVDVDGEAEYTITGMILDPPSDDTDEPAEDDDDNSWSYANGAWLIAEVFPSDYEGPADVYGKCIYKNLNECFGQDVVARFRE
jgi:hypothetical protein